MGQSGPLKKRVDFKATKFSGPPEAVKIYGSQATIVLNSKAEWHQPSIDRVVVTRDLPERQQVRRVGA